jgi:hypothetical protein
MLWKCWTTPHTPVIILFMYRRLINNFLPDDWNFSFQMSDGFPMSKFFIENVHGTIFEFEKVIPIEAES